MKNSIYSQCPDNELVILYQNNRNADAFGELYKRYYSRVYAYVLTILKNRDDAYDLTEETFLAAAEHLYRLEESKNFPAWLFRIARNGCIDCKKSKQKRIMVSVETCAEPVYEAFDYEAALFQETILAKLKDWLEDIPADAKELLIARYFQKKSICELQQEYQLSASAIKMRLLRARTKLSLCYQKACA